MIKADCALSKGDIDQHCSCRHGSNKPGIMRRLTPDPCSAVSDKKLNTCENCDVQLVCGLMSEENLKALLEAVKVDAGLQEKLKAAADDDAVVAMLKREGFDLSQDDFDSVKNLTLELSDYELEMVTGGMELSHSACDKITILIAGCC